MRNTGIVRKIDDLGRIVIPKETRRVLEIEEGTPLEIYVDGQAVVLKKYQASCIFCGEAAEVKDYKGKKVCKGCLKELRNAR
ncbi:AbrB/MazE/SpoVT family DNA-binding domain-containing protein [Clostridium swellfunianum]|uniref:AbrB/MazE/SpoVT family DNA-binding domain-containing protein n=1 Tax=Clostridium swellfunianum TaxID=1367462 RepID=UPI0025470DC2|nr:AbrB/MazE/SpoVT family DNA-binding domain-containing protein [Clostridium swellfunianum]